MKYAGAYEDEVWDEYVRFARKNIPHLEHGSWMNEFEFFDEIDRNGKLPRCAICGALILPPAGKGLCFYRDPETGKKTGEEIWWCEGCIRENLETPWCDWEAVEDGIREEEE